MNPQKKYRLKRRYETPCRSYNVGVIDTVEEWMRVFPEMTPDLFDIKDDWFEPVEDEIRVEVYSEWGSDMKHHVSGKGFYHPYHLNVYGRELSKDDLNKVSAAVLNVLNDKPPYLTDAEMIAALNKKNYHVIHDIQFQSDEKKAKSDLDKAREDAFEAARAVKPLNPLVYLQDRITDGRKYPTLQDYLNSLKVK